MHHPSKNFSFYMIQKAYLKMSNLIFQTSFLAYKVLLPCTCLLYEKCPSSSVPAQKVVAPLYFAPAMLENKFCTVPMLWMYSLCELCRYSLRILKSNQVIWKSFLQRMRLLSLRKSMKTNLWLKLLVVKSPKI